MMGLVQPSNEASHIVAFTSLAYINPSAKLQNWIQALALFRTYRSRQNWSSNTVVDHWRSSRRNNSPIWRQLGTTMQSSTECGMTSPNPPPIDVGWQNCEEDVGCQMSSSLVNYRMWNVVSLQFEMSPNCLAFHAMESQSCKFDWSQWIL